MNRCLAAFVVVSSIYANDAEAGPEATRYINQEHNNIKNLFIDGALRILNKGCVSGGCKHGRKAYEKGQSLMERNSTPPTSTRPQTDAQRAEQMKEHLNKTGRAF